MPSERTPPERASRKRAAAKRGSSAREPLGEYAGKRDFGATPEPALPRGGAPEQGRDDASEKGDEGAELRFVVQEHHARRLHWDLRLEHDGALASWAIPNGIPDDPRRNRKAVHVEDHPLEYIDFHGAIPAGSYGAGAVKIWDHGTYECEKWREDEVIAVFHGERLRGRYALFQAGREDRDWMIHRMDPPADASAEEMPTFIAPMLARLSSRLPAREQEWAFEVKWDGERAIAHSEPGRIRLLSRNGNDITAPYPELRALNRALGSHAAILDGEIIAFADDGRPSFEALQGRIHLRGEAAIRRRARSRPVTYMIFDLLWLDGHSLLRLSYSLRRARLAELELAGPHWQTPESHAGEGSALLEATRQQRLEGVVAKRLDSVYRPGARDGSWLKIKNWLRQEFVIAGWTAGRGARAGRLGALELGVYDERGHLRYAGRVGTGFDARELDRLAELLGPLESSESYFEGAQPPRGGHFVRPELVCEVEFEEWTRDGLLRHSAYKGLSDDKPAASVVRELAQP